MQGIGPVFTLTVSLQNISPSDSAIGLYIVFMCDETLYTTSRRFIEVCACVCVWSCLTNRLHSTYAVAQLPMLVPSLSYDFTTMVECLSDYGRTDIVKASVYPLHMHIECIYCIPILLPFLL